MASGDSLSGALTGVSYFPPSTDFAAYSLTGADVPVLLFDDSTDETAYWSLNMPGQYDGSSALTVEIRWKFATFVGSQTCDWEVAFARIEDDVDSIESLVFATAQVVLATEASATGEVDYATVAFTNAQADGIQPNEAFILRIERDASGGTASPGDAQLFQAEVRET